MKILIKRKTYKSMCYFFFSPVTCTKPCSLPLWAIRLTLCPCCWRMGFALFSSSNMKRHCVTCISIFPLVCFCANWPSERREAGGSP